MMYPIGQTLTSIPAFVLAFFILAGAGCETTAIEDSSAPVTSTEEPTPPSAATKPASQTTTEANSDVIAGDLDAVDWESLVGKTVTIEGPLVVVDNYDLIRRGQIKVARQRLFIPTNHLDPNDADAGGTSYEGGSNVAAISKAKAFNDRATIILDDGTAEENIFPPKLFPSLGSQQPTVRVGSMINGVSGKLVKAGRNLLLVPDQPLAWTPADRPKRPNVGDAAATVASFNVLNYFTTIDDGSNNARGADSESEFARQQSKLVSAILALDADVIGLMELENNLAAEQRLVAALNQSLGEEAFRGCGLPEGFGTAPGGQNAIRVGIIYRADRIQPVGPVKMVVDDAFDQARTPIVQSFQTAPQSPAFTVIVNHFKSKGGSDRAEDADKDKGDGQGGYNATRRAQSLAICDYIDQLAEGQKPARALVIGDLNAYGQEDPIDAMRARGLIDLQERFQNSATPTNAQEHYSFIYYGQAGALDHALATGALANDITGIGTWHINADEPRFLDYNQEYNPKELFQADPFRSSDHDPLLIGIAHEK